MDRQFPPEIIQLIVNASQLSYEPAPSSYQFQRRFSTLQNYSLLNSTWRAVSEPLLYTWVIVRGPKAAERILDGIEGRKATMKAVRDLHVDLGNLDPSVVAKILDSTPHVVNIILREGTVSLDLLAQLHRLRRLELQNVQVVRSTPTSLSLPSLRQLSLRLAPIDPVTRQLLKPAVLPQLRYLQLPIGRIPPTVDRLLRQIEVVDLPVEAYDRLSVVNKLQLVRMPYFPSERQEMFASLSTLPPYLSIDYSSAGNSEIEHEEVIDTLDELLAEAKSPESELHVIFLRHFSKGEQVQYLIKQLRRAGVLVVREERELNFDGAIRAMEDFLAKEKRAEEEKQAVEQKRVAK